MVNSITEQGFIDMINTHERIIYKVSSFYADTNVTLHDLYQEIVMNLWVGYPSFRNDSKQSTWIYRVAFNTCISYYRRKKARPVYVDIKIDVAAEQDRSEEIKELYSLINRLGKIERALILLWLDEKSYQEIAEITGLSPTNVGAKLNRIKSKLKEMSDN